MSLRPLPGMGINMIWPFKRKSPPIRSIGAREITTWAVNSLVDKMIWPDYRDSRFDSQDFIVLFDDGSNYQGGGNDDDRLASRDRGADERAKWFADATPATQQQAGWWKTYLEGYYLRPVQLHKITGSVSGNGGPIFTLYYEVQK